VDLSWGWIVVDLWWWRHKVLVTEAEVKIEDLRAWIQQIDGVEEGARVVSW